MNKKAILIKGNKESIKSRIKKGEVVVGPFCIVPSGTMIDTLGYSGMDFCILDTENRTVF